MTRYRSHSTMAEAISPELALSVNVMGSWGCVLLGAFSSSILWGIACMQIFLYFLIYDKDSVGLKLFIVLVWAFTTADLALSMASMFPPLIVHWGSPEVLIRTQTLLNHHGWISNVVAFCVQMFFLYRIYRFSGNRWLFPLLLLPFALWEIVGSIPLTIWLSRQPPVSITPDPRNINLEIAIRSASAFVDILITAAMVYLLSTNRQSHIRRTSKMVSRLIIMTVNTGVWTAIIALADVALIAAFPNGLQLFAVELPLNPLYLNALLANLNARRFVRQIDRNPLSFESSLVADLGLYGLDTSSRATTDKRGRRSSLAIRIETTCSIHEDDLDLSKGRVLPMPKDDLTSNDIVQEVNRAAV
ncbi:hypothetical protein BD311DRAFT_758874 [Dichomitus squalens]|uniref:DUF6534 domain-containing protein n=1 Tax=Dichomitus squalens TaxID=114155 RepID=A0A4Q9MKT6_9APHY|nr:hypothetical protein BD311DRAFT_758874 [Dichomitus squalens]